MSGLDPDLNVIRLEDYRPSGPSNEHCYVIFLGHPYMEGPTDRQDRVIVEIWKDVGPFIASVRDNGGIYSNRVCEETTFLPWPPAAIRIRHLA